MGFDRVPHGTCIGRRLSGLVPKAERQIALLGQRIVEEVQPEDEHSEVSAIDGRRYQAQGPKWHKRDRQKDLLPGGLRNVDTESEWSKSGYRGSRPRRQAGGTRAGLPRTRPDLRRLASEP